MKSNIKDLYFNIMQCLFLFLTEEAYSHESLRARELGQTPLVLVWLTNVTTSPDLYIEFSTEY